MDEMIAEKVLTELKESFASLCRIGQLEPVQKMAEKHKLTAENVDVRYDNVLFATIASGSLEVLQWVVSHFNVTADKLLEYDNYVHAIGFASRCGRLAVAQWLVDEFGITEEETAPYPLLRPSVGPLIKSAAKMT